VIPQQHGQPVVDRPLVHVVPEQVSVENRELLERQLDPAAHLGGV
jgi:hypothetical protein